MERLTLADPDGREDCVGEEEEDDSAVQRPQERFTVGYPHQE